MFKLIARFLGTNIPYFKGKDKIIRFLYSPNRDLYSGDDFETKYFDKKYKGITSNFIDWGVYFKGGIEKGLVNYIKTQISHFKYFIDIGSNTGTISLPFCDKKNLKIICFEPLNYNFKKLINNYKLNNAYKIHKFHKVALSNKKKIDYIYYSDKDSNIGTASLNKNWYKNIKKKRERIKINKLDNLYKFKNKYIFIKIDVEGHEMKTIEGAKKILKSNKVLIYVETNNNKVINFFKNINYKVYYPIFFENNYKFIKKRQYLHVIFKNF